MLTLSVGAKSEKKEEKKPTGKNHGTTNFSHHQTSKQSEGGSETPGLLFNSEALLWGGGPGSEARAWFSAQRAGNFL